MTTYRVMRTYLQEDRRNVIMFTGQTLQQAKEWCDDPESCSTTCQFGFNKNHTKIHGAWCDQYEEEN